MEIIQTIINFDWTSIVEAIFMILGGFSIIAKLTPTEKDDKVVDAILKVVHKIGLTKK